MIQLLIRSVFLLCMIQLVFLILIPKSFSQCLTDLHKIGPRERIKNYYSHRFGDAIDIYGNTAIVGVSQSDSLQASAGLAFIYEYNGSSWNRIGVLSSSSPMPNENFGRQVQIINNVVFVTVRTDNFSVPSAEGKIYIFEKPATGWQSMNESVTIPFSADNDQLRTAEINKENNAIAVINNGAVEIFYKSTTNWQNTSIPNFTIDFKSTNFSIRDVTIDNNTLAVGLKGDSYNDDRVLLYQNFSGDWTDTRIVQTITRGTYGFADDVMLLNDQLLVSAISYDSDSVFLYTTTNDWNTVEKEVTLTSAHNLISSGEKAYGKAIDMNDSTIIVCRTEEIGFSQPQISIYRKPATGWINAVENQHFILSESRIIIHPPPIAFYDNHLMTTLKIDDPAFENNQVLFYKISDAGHTLNTHLKYNEYNTTGIEFGKEVAIHEDGKLMAVSFLHDDKINIHGGVVNLYSRDVNNNWTFLSRISPPEASTNSIRFGSTIEFYKEYMIVAARSYEEPGTNQTRGAVFVYKKNGPTWFDPTQLAILKPSESALESSDDWLSFGSSIAIEGNTIAIGAPNKDASDNRDRVGKIYIYEKTDSTEWSSGYETASLQTSDAIQNSAIGLSLSLSNQIIATAENWSDEYNKGNVYLFERPATGWKDTTESHTIKITTNVPTPGGYFGLRNSSVILKDDLLFVGFPYEATDGAVASGTIFVLKKSKKGWSEISSINQVRFKNPEQGQLLGIEFDVQENLLIAGTSYIIGNYYIGPKGAKGYATVFQSLKSDWSETIELIKLEGTKSTPIDGFGTSVSLANDYFVIGAHFDDSETGYASGAAYTIPSPPLVYLEDPVCIDAEPFEFNSYPPNGTWSGSGMIDKTTGLFDPAVAGAGIHELTYTTPNCAYKGRFKIEVKEPAAIRFSNATEVKICANETAHLEFTPEENVDYQWHYIPAAGAEPQDFTTTASFIDTDKPGQYFVEASNEICSTNSEVIQVRQLMASVKIEPIPTICNTDNSIPIKVSPPSGTWNTELIKNNNLNPSPLTDGNYAMIYTVSLENTCNYSDTLHVTVDALNPAQVIVNDPDLCTQGAELSALKDDQVRYLWETYKYDDWVTAPENFDQAFYSAKEDGNYRLTVTKHSCAIQTKTFEVKSLPPDSLFVPNVVTLNGDSYNKSFEIYTQNLENIQLGIYNRWGEKIYYSEDYDNSWPPNSIHAGVYFYSLKFNSHCRTNQTDFVKGYVSVLK